jgi:hypothetical protein
MRLKEPFAGFEHTQGHYTYHIAMFLASWFVMFQYEAEHKHTDMTIMSELAPLRGAFVWLRWSHLAAFVLSWTALALERKLYSTARELRSRPTYSRMGSTIFRMASVCQSFLAMFNAMYVLSASSLCMQRKGDYVLCLEVMHAEEVWLSLEVICFWVYMLSIALYIGFHQCRGWCISKEGTKSDLTKQLVDYLEYAKHRMTYAVILSLQMLVTAIVILWAKQATDHSVQADGTLPYEDNVYGMINIMWGLFAVHAIQFALQTPVLTSETREAHCLAQVNVKTKIGGNYPKLRA